MYLFMKKHAVTLDKLTIEIIVPSNIVHFCICFYNNSKKSIKLCTFSIAKVERAIHLYLMSYIHKTWITLCIVYCIGYKVFKVLSFLKNDSLHCY